MSNLLSLPLELRLMIWDYAITTTTRYHDPSHRNLEIPFDKLANFFPALLNTNRGIREEALHLWLPVHTLVFDTIVPGVFAFERALVGYERCGEYGGMVEGSATCDSSNDEGKEMMQPRAARGSKMMSVKTGNTFAQWIERLTEKQRMSFGRGILRIEQYPDAEVKIEICWPEETESGNQHDVERLGRPTKGVSISRSHSKQYDKWIAEGSTTLDEYCEHILALSALNYSRNETRTLKIDEIPAFLDAGLQLAEDQGQKAWNWSTLRERREHIVKAKAY
ncbi:MAG: hypothetical protein M1820_009758 [Bogoriella megaspora]|nr:MAG: hypothetical protein M1820_009758 [Bogoriella megaspora]